MSNHLYDHVFAPHEDNPKPFLIGETQTLSYATFHELVNKLARALIASGLKTCLLYTSPSPRDLSTSRMPSSA